MLKNVFKIAYRNLIRSKGFSSINITGLAIGMASAMLILLWVQNEFTYDNFYENQSRLYQVWNKGKGNDGYNCWNTTPKILGPTLKKDYPEVEQSTRVNWGQSILFTVGEKKLPVTGTMVDPDFLTMFKFPFIEGNMNTALNNPSDIVITQKLAKKLFGNEQAMGKTVLLDNKNSFTVSGIMQDLPNNTQFSFDYLLPWSYMKLQNADDSSWGNNSTTNYVMLKPNTSIAAVNEKIKNIIISHGEPDWTTQSFLYPVSRLRLYSTFNNGVPAGGKIESVRVFTIIAVLILLIACINFMNMSTARSEKRAKEVGIRKVAGAQKKSLVTQFLGESILIALIAGVLAIITVQLCLPAFNELTKKQLSIGYGSLQFWVFFIGFILFTGVLAGSYPALFLSSFKPISVLKGSFKKAHALVTPRKILVVAQFSIAVTLIICTIIIKQQTKYAQDRQTGYDKNNMVFVFLTGDLKKNYQLVKNDLTNAGIATAISKTSAPLTEGWMSGGVEWDGKDPNLKTEFNLFNADENIVKTAGLQLVQGRDIDVTKYATDSTAALLNETAAKLIGFKDPIGKIIDREDDFEGWHIVGVVKDFILQSPFEKIKPMMIRGAKSDWFNLMHIKLNAANNTAKNLAAAEKIFKRYNPQYPFSYLFVDEQYAKKFSDEQTTGILTAFFAGLTIFISCLGLFGLATYMAESRVKEIGIRKVLGASVANITALLSGDFVKLVFISILIASPLAWWAMNKWLAGFDYRVGISWVVFVAAGVCAVLIALFTVSFQAIKAAVANPVKSLRTE